MKMLTKPLPDLCGGGDDESIRIHKALHRIEKGLISSGAKPIRDYSFQDLIMMVCHMDAFSTDSYLVREVGRIARALQLLGNGDGYSGPPGVEKGAIEAFGMTVCAAIESISTAIGELSNGAR